MSSSCAQWGSGPSALLDPFSARCHPCDTTTPEQGVGICPHCIFLLRTSGMVGLYGLCWPALYQEGLAKRAFGGSQILNGSPLHQELRLCITSTVCLQLPLTARLPMNLVGLITPSSRHRSLAHASSFSPVWKLLGCKIHPGSPFSVEPSWTTPGHFVPFSSERL